MLRNKHLFLTAVAPLLVIGGIAGASWLGPIELDLDFLNRDTTQASVDKAKPARSAAGGGSGLALARNLSSELAGGSGPESKPRFGIDVARIEPNGTSVIAGLAMPNTEVTVIADGAIVGTTRTDSSGEWVLVSSYKFKSASPKITLEYGSKRTKVAALAAGERTTQTDTAPVTSLQRAITSESEGKPVQDYTAEAVRLQLMDRLKKLANQSSAPKSDTKVSQSGASAPGRVTQRKGADVKRNAEHVSSGANVSTAPAKRRNVAVLTGQQKARVDNTSGRKTGTVTGTTNLDASGRSKPISTNARPDAANVTNGGVATPHRKAGENLLEGRSERGLAADPGLVPRSGVAKAENRTLANPAPAKGTVRAVARSTRIASATSPSYRSAVAGGGSSLMASNAAGTATTGSLPIPIKFEYRSAAFTATGREAAQLLLKYLKNSGFKAVTLTGHADERGSEHGNMRLSKRRLLAIQQFLRRGGFDGELTLIPMGESAKFTGIDRSKYSAKDLWELDRRVELKDAS